MLLWCSVQLLPRLRPDSTFHRHSPGSGCRSIEFESGKNPTGAGFRTRNGICMTIPILVKHRAPFTNPGYLTIGYYLPRRRGTPFLALVCVLMHDDVFWLPRKKHFPSFLFSRDSMIETRESKAFLIFFSPSKACARRIFLEENGTWTCRFPEEGKNRKDTSRLPLNGRGVIYI